MRSQVRIPVAVKLAPYFTSVPNMAARLDRLGVQALVLFNRFYQPDIDIEALSVQRTLELSTSEELGALALGGDSRRQDSSRSGDHREAFIPSKTYSRESWRAQRSP